MVLPFVTALSASAILTLLATPRPLPFTYTHETLAAGDVEVEQYVDLVPGKATVDGRPTTFVSTLFQTEVEYGLTDKLEVALYGTLGSIAPSGVSDVPEMPVGNGMKQRFRWRFADEGSWPVDVALYGEIAEQSQELELEWKVIVQKRIARRLRVVANAWFEREIEYKGDQAWVVHPTLGATVEVTPMLHLGLESWMRFALEDGERQPTKWTHGPHLYAGPALLLNFGRVWWSAGMYLRATDLGRRLDPGEGYGPVWMRSILGVTL